MNIIHVICSYREGGEKNEIHAKGIKSSQRGVAAEDSKCIRSIETDVLRMGKESRKSTDRESGGIVPAFSDLAF